MNNAINNQFKMKMGSKQKDTEGSFNEKDSGILKQSPLYNIANALAAGERNKEAAGNKYDKMADSFNAGKKEGLVGDTKEDEDEPQGGYKKTFSDIADNAEKDSKNIDLLGSLSGIEF